MEASSANSNSSRADLEHALTTLTLRAEYNLQHYLKVLISMRCQIMAATLISLR